jgi:hypothetical protein
VLWVCGSKAGSLGFATHGGSFFWRGTVLGFEFRVSHLLGRCLLLEAHPQPFFVLGIFEIGSCELFAWVGLKPRPS